MTFQFESFQDFITMAGHGPYVWACYAITFALMLYLITAPSLRTRQFIREQKRLAQRIAAAQKSGSQSSNF